MVWWILISSVRIWHQLYNSMDPTCPVLTIWPGGGGVIVCGMLSFFLAPFRFMITNQLLLSCHSPFEYNCWPWSQWSHLLTMTTHVTKQKSVFGLVSWKWPWGSVSFGLLSSHWIRKQKDTFGMWKNGRLAAWKRTCWNRVMWLR